MNARACAVRMSIVVTVILATITLASTESNQIAGAASNTNSTSGLANAKLPPGMCNSHLPVTLSHGYGHANTNPDSISYFNISLTSGPVTVDVNHDGIKDTAAVF